MSFLIPKMQVLQRVDSTNNYAMGLVQKGVAKHGNSVFALEQTEGKGRRGKVWKSNIGANIILSIVSEMKWLSVGNQFHLSVAVALAAHDLISKYIFTNVFIKWPNDLFINDSKAGGILIENVIKGTLWQWSVIGIGINVNQQAFEPFQLKATSLKLETEKNFNVIALAIQLAELVLHRIEELKNDNFAKMLVEYNLKLLGREEWVKLKKENSVFITQISGVSDVGQLITANPVERRFNFDEVEFQGLVRHSGFQ